MQGFLLFDIDGVIRDVAKSYRLAIQETVEHFMRWRPSIEIIDSLKAEGCWNNDWDASLEIMKRYQLKEHQINTKIPAREDLIKIFSDFYFGGDPNGDSAKWTGFIKDEPLLVENNFFEQISKQGFSWGFVSGAELPSAKFVLENRLGLKNPPLIAMGDAPDKPDPTGLIKLATRLAGRPLGEGVPPIAYLGDTVADVKTIANAKKLLPNQKFIGLGIAPPHLHTSDRKKTRYVYEDQLRKAGADKVLTCTTEILKYLSK